MRRSSHPATLSAAAGAPLLKNPNPQTWEKLNLDNKSRSLSATQTSEEFRIRMVNVEQELHTVEKSISWMTREGNEGRA